MRTDNEIKEDVRDELIWEPSISSKEVFVDVKNGSVTLSGSVDTYSKKIAAQSAAERVSGVTRVTNNIEVKLASIHRRSDSELEKTVKNVLEWNTTIPDDKVKVQVRDGWVTLDGSVEWDFQKRAATRVSEDLAGVKGVTNLIHLAAAVPTTAEVKSKIESALKRNININGEQINVSVEGSKVRLSGKVRSFTEKFDAERAAWSAPGVSAVDSQLAIIPAEIYAE
jgi:osmotically-inducible protein OsmY